MGTCITTSLYKCAIERVIAGVWVHPLMKSKEKNVLPRIALGNVFGIQKGGGRTMPFNFERLVNSSSIT